MRWEPPEHEHGLPVLVYHLQYALSLQHSKQPHPWQAGPQVADTCSQACPLMYRCPLQQSHVSLHSRLCPARNTVLPAEAHTCCIQSSAPLLH